MVATLMAGLLGALLSAASVPAAGAGGGDIAQAMGSRCQTPAGSCTVSPPRPLGAFCTCGSATGYVTA